MKYFYLIKNTFFLFFICLFISCGSKQEIVYYQNTDSLDKGEALNSYEIKIQPDDLLMIVVSAEDPEIAAPFNLKTTSVVSPTGQDLIGQQSLQLYLVDSKGIIDFPVLGKIKIIGKTRTEVVGMLSQKIASYIKNPIVNLRIMNFKVSVMGEVTNPGTFSINSERLTLIEALSMAKDLTIYGKRDNILIIREVDGKKSFNRVDLTKADFINSPFYYLSQNDVVYVEPNRTKINGSKVGANTGVIISAASILVTLITLIISITK